MKTALGLFLWAVAASAQPWAITRVAVVDVEGGRALPDMTVVVNGDRIQSVGPANRTKPPRGARIIDARGKFLIPGLWDMHVHMLSSLPPPPGDSTPGEFYAPRFLENGITGVRSMFDSLALVRALAAPRAVASGTVIDGPNPYWPGFISCSNPDQARAAVKKLKTEGVDFVKVYSGLPRDAYFAVADETRKAGLPFAGHLPNSVSAAEASDAGQKSLEHLMGFDKEQPEVWARFVKNGTWVTPTLAVLRSAAFYTDPEYTKDDRIPQLPPFVQMYWKNGWRWILKEQEPQRKAQYARQLEIVGKMHRAGVKLLTGTDTPNPYVFPGTSLHDEMELFVQAGISPAEVLRIATLGAADFFGWTDRLGTVTPGKLADLVLLSADPLAAIANTRKVVLVAVNGKIVLAPKQ